MARLVLLGLAAVGVSAGGGLAPGAPQPGSDPYGNIVDYTNATNLANILPLTNQNCDWLEGPFEETFSLPTLNTTRWDPSSMSGTDHCVGLPPSGPAFCTAMLPSQLKLAVSLPNATTSYGVQAYGAQLTLSQVPCANGTLACVWNSTSGAQAYWAGAHLVSNGCVQYGVLEMEAKFSMPPTGGAFFFLATYLVKGTADPSWNEIDLGFINGPRGGPTWTSATDNTTLNLPYTNNGAAGLEFHATLFTAAPSSPTATTMDALIYDATGPANGIGGTPKRNDSSAQNGQTNVNATFTTGFAANWHTYKIVWAKNWMAWMVDTAVYRNVTFAPWRPQSIRLILRTNIGTPASTATLPDSNVYIRRIRYTPLSAQAVSDAINFKSMAAKYGDTPLAPPTYAVCTAGAATATTSATGRRLSAVIDSNAAATQLQTAIAAVIPGVSASAVNVEILGYATQGSLVLSGVSDFNAGVQAAMMSGLATATSDPMAKSVYIVSSATLGSGNWSITFAADGYMNRSTADADALTLLTNPATLAYTLSAIYAVETDPNYVASYATSGYGAASQAFLSNGAGSYQQLPVPPFITMISTSSFTMYGITITSDASNQQMIEAELSNVISSGVLTSQLAKQTSPSARHLHGASSNVVLVPPTPAQAVNYARRVATRPPPVDQRVPKPKTPSSKKFPPPPKKKVSG